MPLEIHKPQPPLTDYVEMLWYWEGYHPPHPKERILPAGMMEITINLADEPFYIYDSPQATHEQAIYGPMMAGARSDYYVVDTSRSTSVLAVLFKPGGAMPIFGVPAAELHNLHLPLACLWGTAADELYDQLLNATTSTQRFRILEHALLARLRRVENRHPAVGYALSLFQAQTQKISDVLDEIALSSTRFNKVFRDDVGMSPKLFCRVQRFQRALKLMACQPSVDWIDVALTSGYYDQSHLINDFQTFAGMTPTAYAPQSRDHNSNLPLFD